MGSRRVETYIAYGVAGFVVSLVAVQFIASDGPGLGDYISYAFMAAVGWWAWPSRKGSHVDHEAIQAKAAAEDIIIYWRPG